MSKITSQSTIVDMLGDEMAQVGWERIREQILKFVDIKVETYDLSLETRFKTNNGVVDEAIKATKLHKTAVKCAGITPNKAQVDETLAKLGLKEADIAAGTKKSPNGKLRKGIDCHLMMRGDIGLPGVKALIPSLTGRPIDIARHGQGDEYEAFDAIAPTKGKLQVVLDGKVLHERDTFEGDPICLLKNNKSSIERFARSTFAYALLRKFSVMLGTKNTILQNYDNIFKETFDRVYNNEFNRAFESSGITYSHQLIDSLAAKILSSNGNLVVAVKNFMGDVLADQVAELYGSLATFSSVLIGADDVEIFEAPHGTAPDLYKLYKTTGVANFNPIASQVAWTGALRHVGVLENNPALQNFANKYDDAIKETVGSGTVTADLSKRMEDGIKVNTVDLNGFLTAVEEKLVELLK